MLPPKLFTGRAVAILIASLVLTVGIIAVGSSSRIRKSLSLQNQRASTAIQPLPATRSSSNQAKISWSESQINLTLSPGESRSKNLTFTSTLPLTNVEIEAVPEISPMLKIQPDTFSRVPPNQAQAVGIDFSINPTTAVGTYEGTVHVRSGSQTLPQTLKVSLTVLTYVNRDLGIGFDLPDFNRPTRVTVSNDQPGQSLLDVEVQSTPSAEFVSAFGLVLYANPAKLSLLEWFEANVDVENILLTNNTYQAQKLSNGLDVLVLTQPIPTEYAQRSGPVAEAYAISPGKDFIISIEQSDVSQLSDLGYSQDSIRTLLLNVLRSVHFIGTQ